MRPSGDFREDIQGLRALAVFAVVVYHLGVPWARGGFVGVDVFFVISGYLMARRVRNEIEREGRVRYGRFILRRVRRIYPALLTTIVSAGLLTVFVLPPHRAAAAGRAALAAVGSASNIHYWTTAGYWEPASAVRPFLHTWSLGVEFQFYLVVPLVLVGTLTRRRAWFPVVCLALISFGVADLMTAHLPEAGFYLLPARLWEFLVGVLLTWLPRLSLRAQTQALRTLRATMLVVGLCLIVGSMIAFVPGASSGPRSLAIPVSATALVLLADAPSPYAGLLANRLSQTVGAWSYSLYLVHWPLIVLAAVAAPGRSLVWRGALIVPVTVLLSWLSYRFVETPVARSVNPLRGERIGLRAIAGAGGLVMALSGIVIATSDARVASLTEGVVVDARAHNQARHQSRASLCNGDEIICGVPVPGRRNVLVLGDSTGDDVISMLIAEDRDANYLLSIQDGCPPVAARGDERCRAFNEVRDQEVTAMAADLDEIVVAMYIDAERVEPLFGYLPSLATLGSDVIVVGPGPSYDRDVVDILLDSGSGPSFDEALTASLAHDVFDLDAQLRVETAASGARYVSRLEWMCPRRRCRGFVPGSTDLVVFDRGHMTVQAARSLGGWLADRAPTDGSLR